MNIRLYSLVMLLLLVGICLSASQSNNFDTLTLIKSGARMYRYNDRSITEYCTRFTINNQCNIRSIIIPLGGGSGEFRVRVFGDEGGGNASTIENDIIPPVLVTKRLQGVENITIPIANCPRISYKQIFVTFDKLNGDIHFFTDKQNRTAQCISNIDSSSYHRQYLKKNNGRWYSTPFAFNVSLIIENIDNEDAVFLYDSLFFQKANQVANDRIQNDSLRRERNNLSFSCADINNDGFIDIVTQNRVLLNQKGISVVDATSQLGIDKHSSSANMLVDLNNDGWTDILFIESLGSQIETKGYLNTGGIEGSAFQPIPISLKVEYPVQCYAVHDIDNDKYDDVVIITSNGSATQLYVLRHSIEGTLIQDTILLKFLIQEFNSIYSIRFFDIDEDGNEDLVIDGVSNGIVGTFVYDNYANPTLRSPRLLRGVDKDKRLNTEETYSAFADVDEDNALDLISSFDNMVHKRIDNTQISPYTTSLRRTGVSQNLQYPRKNIELQYSENVGGITIGDINNDGSSDILLSSSCVCKSAVGYVSDPNGILRYEPLRLGLHELYQNEDIALVDVDNNGLLDALTLSDDRIALFKNSAKNLTGNYISISRDNQVKEGNSCITKAVAYSNDRQFLVSNFTSNGRLVQYYQPLHIGIGNTASVDSVKLTWNDGTRSTMYNVEINKNNIATKPQLSVEKNSDVEINAYPNPFKENIDITIDLNQDIVSGKPLTLSIYNSNSVLVRVLNIEDANANRIRLRWDGLNSQGISTASGAYTLMVTVNDKVYTKSVLKNH